MAVKPKTKGGMGSKGRTKTKPKSVAKKVYEAVLKLFLLLSLVLFILPLAWPSMQISILVLKTKQSFQQQALLHHEL
jgi:hypothetical protein